MSSICEIRINNNLLIDYLKRGITEETLRKLIVIMSGKADPSIFKHRNKSPLDINIKLYCDQNLFSEDLILADLNSLDPDDITEKAAIGFIFSFFLYIYPGIKNIKACLKGEGYDYKCRRNQHHMKIEISGVNSENRNTFNKRIYTKKRKFKENKYEPKSDEELIGIVDFFYFRYIICEVD